MIPSKAFSGQFIDRIVATQDEKETRRTVKETLNQMLRPQLIEMGEQEANVDVIISELAESILPLAKDVHREGLELWYEPEQLRALAEFYEANPWYCAISNKLSVWTNKRLMESSQAICEAVFKKHFPED